MIIRRLNTLFEQYVQATGVNIQLHCFCVVSTDVAAGLMREVSTVPTAKVTFSSDEDVLIVYDNVPIILRHRVPPGTGIVLEKAKLPPRSCCDDTAMQTIMLSISRGAS
jgi:hypothetical protein